MPATSLSVPPPVSLDDEVLAPELSPIAIRLADEGIPVACIARGLKQPAAQVREALHEAHRHGAISEMPPEDWPATAKKSDHVPWGQCVRMSEDDLLVSCMKVFKVTRLQASVLVVILKREEAWKETLHCAIENRRATRSNLAANLEETDPKIVDVVICHLRKRLKPFDLRIETLWARGYYMRRETRARAFEIIQQFDAPSAPSVADAA